MDSLFKKEDNPLLVSLEGVKRLKDSGVIEFILGGARSGKSSYAEQRIGASESLSVLYVATAAAGDSEMQKRIDIHQKSRPAHWHTLESPLQLADALNQNEQDYDYILVDCLTLWLTNCLCHKLPEVFSQEREALLNSLKSFNGKLLLVSNEVGTGIVPMGELSRKFVDEAGWLHQAIAQIADNVTWVVAGLQKKLK